MDINFTPADDCNGELLAALKIGERDIAAGRTVPYRPELLKQIEQEARTHAANNRPVNPDVVPPINTDCGREF
jgi:hypothetical protein